MFNLALTLTFVLCTLFSVFSKFEAAVIAMTGAPAHPPGVLTMFASLFLFLFIFMVVFVLLRVIPGIDNLQMAKKESDGLTLGNGLLTSLGGYWLLAIYGGVGATGSSAEIFAMIGTPAFVTLCITAGTAIWVFARAILSEYGMMYDEKTPNIVIEPITTPEIFWMVVFGIIPVLYVIHVGNAAKPAVSLNPETAVVAHASAPAPAPALRVN